MFTTNAINGKCPYYHLARRKDKKHRISDAYLWSPYEERITVTAALIPNASASEYANYVGRTCSLIITAPRLLSMTVYKFLNSLATLRFIFSSKLYGHGRRYRPLPQNHATRHWSHTCLSSTCQQRDPRRYSIRDALAIDWDKRKLIDSNPQHHIKNQAARMSL